MNILILGGTGRTGKHIVAEALQRGHTVNVLVRDKEKVKETPNLKIYEGNPSEAGLLEKSIQGCEVVVSALNISRTSDFPWSRLRTPKDFLSRTVSNIISLSTKHSINRVVVISAWGANESKREIPTFFRWLIDHSNMSYAYLEHENQERLLKNAHLHWTAVRPVGLTNSAKAKAVRVSFDGKPRPKPTVGRKTVAKFILDMLEQHTYINQAPTISEE